MTIQKYFDFQFLNSKDKDNFFVNKTNQNAYDLINYDNFNQDIFLLGPRKSGKSNLLKIWKEKNQAVFFKNNFNDIIKSNNNIAIDDIFLIKNEEEIFHIINHCKSYNLKILATSSIDTGNHDFKFKDFFSRIRSFYHIKINQPDDEMCKNVILKLFHQKQIIIKNEEIFNFIFNRINRTYHDVYYIVKTLDKLSLEKKRQLTIPLIREIL